jgi:hypothetical protein
MARIGPAGSDVGALIKSMQGEVDETDDRFVDAIDGVLFRQ